MKLCASILGAVVSAVILAGTANGTVIHVPADQPTINLAIAAAVDGDSILVDPGTYVETVDFLGKAITVSAANPDPTLTLIVAPASATAVVFQSGETGAAQLEGFTLTGGSGVKVGGRIVGGNLLVNGASPTLKNLVVRDNLGVQDGGGAWFSQSSSSLAGIVFRNCLVGDFGGGLYAANSSLVIDHCTFDTCTAISEGGGLAFQSCSSITILDSDVTANEASYAGGLYAEQTTLDLSGCRFDGNVADENSGGGMGLINCGGVVSACSFTNNVANPGYGGGLHIGGDSPITIEDCDFRTNFASLYGNHIGVETQRGSSGPTITGCSCSDAKQCVYLDGAALFEHDDFAGVPGGIGVYVKNPGAIRFVDVSVHGFDSGVEFYDTDVASLERCRLTDNPYTAFSSYRGSGVVEDCLLTGSHLGAWCENTTILFDGCTITQNVNTFSYAGGISFTGTKAPTLRNTILRGNAPIEIVDLTGGLPKMEYCDVGGGWPGTGNVDTDPLFVDALNGDFTLKSTSPCIDAGDPALVTTRRELFGRPRRLDGALVRAERVDMGAFEFGQLTLAVSGSATPGGTLTIDTSGSPALLVFLIASLGEAEIDHKFLGTFYVDFTSALPLIYWGSPPSSIQVQLAPDFPAPLTFHLQEVGLLTTNGSGATSNDVVVDVK